MLIVNISQGFQWWQVSFLEKYVAWFGSFFTTNDGNPPLLYTYTCSCEGYFKNNVSYFGNTVLVESSIQYPIMFCFCFSEQLIVSITKNVWHESECEIEVYNRILPWKKKWQLLTFSYVLLNCLVDVCLTEYKPLWVI